MGRGDRQLRIATGFRLGLLMLAQGWITHPQLQKALAAQRESGTGRIGEWLMSECGLEAEQIVRGLSMQWGCPVLTTEGFSPEAMALVMPKIFVEEFGLLPMRVAGSRILYLGFADRLDASAAFATEQMTELKVESGVVEGGSVRGCAKKAAGLRGSGDEARSSRRQGRNGGEDHCDSGAEAADSVTSGQAASILLAEDLAGERRSGEGGGKSAGNE